MAFYTYLLTNMVNGKVYVGKAKDPARRWRQHKCDARTKVTPLYKSMRKYGLDSFRLDVLCGFPCEADAFAHESSLIASMRTRDMAIGYNLTDGGEGVSGMVVSPERRKHLSDMNRGRRPSEEARANQAESMRGRVLSPEHRAKLSAALRGKPKTEAHRCALSKAHAGKPLSAEHLRKMRDAHQVVSVDTRAKLSASSRRAWARRRTTESIPVVEAFES